jgi:cardiolipin synthase
MTIEDEVTIHRLKQHGHALDRPQHGDPLLVSGELFVAEMCDVEARYSALSREPDARGVGEQPLRSTVLDNLARLTSAPH